MHGVVLAATALAVATAAASGTPDATARFVVVDSTQHAVAPDTAATGERDAAPRPAPVAPRDSSATASGTGAAITAQIDSVAAAARGLPVLEGRVLDELLAAARELAAEGDVEAAALVLEDARALVQRGAR